MKYTNPKTFVMGGDMGDLVYHLLFIKQLGGTTFHIDPSGGEEYSRPGIADMKKGKFNLSKALFILPLIKTQTYVEDVSFYSGRPCDAYKVYDVNAGEYAPEDISIRNLTHFHAKKYGLSLDNLNEPWLEVEKKTSPDEGRDTIINRTTRYRGNDNYYFFNKHRIENKAIFVGLEEEYSDFVQRYSTPNLPYVQVNDALHMAEIINGHDKFIGNGSLACSIAMGLGKDIEYEYCPVASHYLFQRNNIEIF
jgi:hypothetical protein